MACFGISAHVHPYSSNDCDASLPKAHEQSVRQFFNTKLLHKITAPHYQANSAELHHTDVIGSAAALQTFYRLIYSNKLCT